MTTETNKKQKHEDFVVTITCEEVDRRLVRCTPSPKSLLCTH